MRKKVFELLSLMCGLSSIIVMLLPFCFTIKWLNPNPSHIEMSTFSYFDITPYAYGFIFPFATAILSSIFLAVGILSLKLKKLSNFAFLLSIMNVILSIISITSSFRITIPSILIALLLLLSFIFQMIIKMRTNKVSAP